MAAPPIGPPPPIAVPPGGGSFPLSSGTSGNPSQTNPSQIIQVNGPKVANPLDLKYNLLLVNAFLPAITADYVNPLSIAYHGGYNKIAVDEIKFFDCDNLVLTNTSKEVVSDYRSKGIMELRPSNAKYYWDEVYTTPLGLYLFKNSPISLGDLYKFTLSAPNKIKLHTEDPNIIPKVDDYLIFQRFFDVNTFSNESTTDDLNNVLVYPKSETFQFKIVSIAPTTGVATSVSLVDLTGTAAVGQIKVTTISNHNLTTGDKVYIGSVVGIPDSNGTFTINVVSLTEFELLALDNVTPIIGTGTYIAGGVVTALPLYEIELDKTFSPIGANVPSFSVVNASLLVAPPFPLVTNQIEITTSAIHKYSTGTKVDISGIVGVVGSNGTFYVYVTSTTTFALFSDPQLQNPVIGSGVYVSGGTLNEAPAKYTLVLLNRMGTTANQELFTDTWRQAEIHRQQLLGDPFLETSILKFVGHKNYLQYGNSSYLGMQHLLAGVLETAKTPFIIFDIQDDIKDRLYQGDGAMEVHLPGVMINSEDASVVLKNKGPILKDIAGNGEYTGLYFLDAINPTQRSIRYGWVMHELRIVVIDHAELVTALGYNSNRSYTLPTPVLKAQNTIQNPTNSDPLTISNVQATTPVGITTATPHGLKLGDKVQINNVQPNYLLPDGVYYAGGAITNTTFKAYLDSGLTIPTIGVGAYTGGGTLVGFKLPYEYFVTYRINGKHYNTAPYSVPLAFNFDVSNQIQLSIPQLSHLVDGNNFEGFEANTFEIVIGKYKQDPIDSLKIVDNEYVTLAPVVVHKYNGVNHNLVSTPNERRQLPLKDASGNQVNNTGHTITVNRNDIEDVFGNWLPATVDIISPSAPVGYEYINIQYNLVDIAINSPYDLYNTIYGIPIYYEQTVIATDSTLFAGNGIWTLGFLKYKQQAMQYRLTMRAPIPAGKWNGSTNPSYEPGNSLMKNKLITELSFLIDDPLGAPNDPNAVIETPYIYGKISPALEKNNSTDLSIEVSIDF